MILIKQPEQLILLKFIMQVTAKKLQSEQSRGYTSSSTPLLTYRQPAHLGNAPAPYNRCHSCEQRALPDGQSDLDLKKKKKEKSRASTLSNQHMLTGYNEENNEMLKMT